MQKETNQYKHLFIVAGGWINNKIKTVPINCHDVMSVSPVQSLAGSVVPRSLVPPWCSLWLLPRDHFCSFLVFPQPDSECCIIVYQHIPHLFLWSENVCCLSIGYVIQSTLWSMSHIPGLHTVWVFLYLPWSRPHRISGFVLELAIHFYTSFL